MGICLGQSIYPIKRTIHTSSSGTRPAAQVYIYSNAGFNCIGHCTIPKESRVTLGNSRMPQARKDAAMAMENDVLRWSAPQTQNYLSY